MTDVQPAQPNCPMPEVCKGECRGWCRWYQDHGVTPVSMEGGPPLADRVAALERRCARLEEIQIEARKAQEDYEKLIQWSRRVGM